MIESLAYGGAESVTVNLANTLSRNGVTVGLSAADGALVANLLPAVKFFGLPPFAMVNIVPILYSISRNIKLFRPDIIHCQNAAHCALVKAVLCFSRGPSPRTVFTYHSIRTERIPNLLSGLIFNMIAERLIVIAEHRKQSMIKLGVNPEKIFAIPNFIDLENWNSRKQGFDRRAFRKSCGIPVHSHLLLVSSRLVKSKNIDVFLQIVAEVRKFCPDVFGVVVGDGPERERLEKLVTYYGIEGHILFTGFKIDVLPYYLASDIFVFPSEYEVLPMVLIEAAASGLPVVGSLIPGNNEVVREGKTGFLLSGDAKNYAEKIRELFSSPDLYAEFSKNAVKIAASAFSENKCLRQILEVYG